MSAGDGDSGGAASTMGAGGASTIPEDPPIDPLAIEPVPADPPIEPLPIDEPAAAMPADAEAAPLPADAWRLKYQFVCSCDGTIAFGWSRVSTPNISQPRSPRSPDT
jgi:hypothetical protein